MTGNLRDIYYTVQYRIAFLHEFLCPKGTSGGKLVLKSERSHVGPRVRSSVTNRVSAIT